MAVRMVRPSPQPPGLRPNPAQTEIGSGSDYLLRRVRRLQVAQGQHGLGLIERNALLQGLFQARQSCSYRSSTLCVSRRSPRRHFHARLPDRCARPRPRCRTRHRNRGRNAHSASSRSERRLADCRAPAKAHVRAAVIHGVRALVVPNTAMVCPCSRRRHNPLLLQFRERRHTEQPVLSYGIVLSLSTSRYSCSHRKSFQINRRKYAAITRIIFCSIVALESSARNTSRLQLETTGKAVEILWTLPSNLSDVDAQPHHPKSCDLRQAFRLSRAPQRAARRTAPSPWISSRTSVHVQPSSKSRPAKTQVSISSQAFSARNV